MKVPGGGGKRTSRYLIAALDDCRAAYDKRHGRLLEWPDPQTGGRGFGQTVIPLDEDGVEMV
jgi:hypothetical protein